MLNLSNVHPRRKGGVLGAEGGIPTHHGGPESSGFESRESGRLLYSLVFAHHESCLASSLYLGTFELSVIIPVFGVLCQQLFPENSPLRAPWASTGAAM